MQRRRTQSLNLPTSDHDCEDPELKLERVLSHLSYIRINIDEIVLPEENPLIERLFNEGSLYGFNLEYKFPCLEHISRCSKTPVRIPAKSFTMTSIQFRHKRVVLLQMTPNTVPPWKQHNLVIHLHVQLNAHGKFSTRLLGYCVVPLGELLIPPFMICRDFPFIPAKGMKFEGSSLIRIDLGSREKKLMEKINAMRDPLLESTHVVDGGSLLTKDTAVCPNSRIALHSRNDLHASENEPPPCTTTKQNGLPSQRSGSGHPLHTVGANRIAPKINDVPLRERPSSNLTDLSDSVFDDRGSVYSSSRPVALFDARNLCEAVPRREFRPAVRSDTSSNIRERERASPSRKCLVQLTVHEGRGLPLVQDERNRYVSPNSYISVLGRDGELRSTVCERSRRPLWNWTGRFYICGERRNIIVKVFHHDINGDKTLGFVSIPLPIEEAHRVDYEMVDLTGTASVNGEVPVITFQMSMEATEVITRSGSSARMRSSSSSLSEPPLFSRTPTPHSASTCSNCQRHLNDETPIITATREELAEKLKQNLADLDQLIKKIKE